VKLLDFTPSSSVPTPAERLAQTGPVLGTALHVARADQRRNGFDQRADITRWA
jgi:hypothetical protein